jgi:hypothetical protein
MWSLFNIPVFNVWFSKRRKRKMKEGKRHWSFNALEVFQLEEVR